MSEPVNSVTMKVLQPLWNESSPRTNKCLAYSNSSGIGPPKCALNVPIWRVRVFTDVNGPALRVSDRFNSSIEWRSVLFRVLSCFLFTEVIHDRLEAQNVRLTEKNKNMKNVVKTVELQLSTLRGDLEKERERYKCISEKFRIEEVSKAHNYLRNTTR